MEIFFRSYLRQSQRVSNCFTLSRFVVIGNPENKTGCPHRCMVKPIQTCIDLRRNRRQGLRETSSRATIQYTTTALTCPIGCQKCQGLSVNISSNLNRSTHVDRVTVNARRPLRFIKCNVNTKSPKSEEWHINPFFVPNWNMLQQCGTPIPRKRHISMPELR